MQQNNDDDNQQQQNLTSEYSTHELWFEGAAASSGDGPTYHDIVKVLSQVELPSPSPSPSPAPELPETFHGGQSSGTKKVDDEIEGNIEREMERKDIHENLQESGIRSTRQRRRTLIYEKIQRIKEAIPNCNKRDQISILDDAIKHIKSMHLQLQMIQFMGGNYTVPQGLYMSPTSFQAPYFHPYFMMRPMNEMGYSMGPYGPYFNSFSPVFPPIGSFYHPPMQMGTGSPTLLLPSPHLHCSSPPSEHVFSTTLSSDNFIAPGSQVGSGISSQSPYTMPTRN